MKYVTTELKDFMFFFGYASKSKDEETEDDCFSLSEQWVQEQQTQYNFAKYLEINEKSLN